MLTKCGPSCLGLRIFRPSISQYMSPFDIFPIYVIVQVDDNIYPRNYVHMVRFVLWLKKQQQKYIAIAA